MARANLRYPPVLANWPTGVGDRLGLPGGRIDVLWGVQRLLCLCLVTCALLLPLKAQALAMRHFDNRDGLPQSQ